VKSFSVGASNLTCGEQPDPKIGQLRNQAGECCESK